MFRPLQRHQLSAGVLAGVLVVIAPLAALAAPVSTAVDESVKDLAAVISVAPVPPNIDFLVGQALLRQNQPNLALGYLLRVTTADVEYRSAQSLIKTIQNPILKKDGGAAVPATAQDAALLSISSAYEGYGWVNLPKTQARIIANLGPARVYEKSDQLLIAVPYRAGDTPPAKMGAAVLAAVQPYVKSKVAEVHIVWFNKKFEILEMVYTVDRNSRQFLPKTWLFNDAPIQIGYPSQSELKKLKKFVLSGF